MMGRVITGAVSDLPDPWRKLSEDSANRVQGMVALIRSLDERVAALGEARWRKAARTCQAALVTCAEGITLAEKQRRQLFFRNSAGLAAMVSNELVRDRQAANLALAQVPSGAVLQRAELDPVSSIMLASARVVTESDAWILQPDPRTGAPQKVRDPDSVAAGAIKIATRAAKVIKRAQEECARAASLAELPDGVTGPPGAVADLLQQATNRSWFEALSPKECVDVVGRQLDGALNADPPDLETAKRLEIAALPAIAKLSRLGSSEISRRILAASNKPALRVGEVDKIILGVIKILKRFGELRASRVSPDLQACAAILESCAQIWNELCGANCLQFLTTDEFRETYLNRSSWSSTLEERRWFVDPAWLIRSSSTPAVNASLRKIPGLREAYAQADMKQLTALRTGGGKT